MKKPEFQIGDRVYIAVEAPEGYEHIHMDDTGVVCHLSDRFDEEELWVGVRFDRCLEGCGHTCEGHCEDDYGFYLPPYSLWLESLPLAPSDEDVFSMYE